MTKRAFHGEEFYLWALKKYEDLRAYRNKVSKLKPNDEVLEILKMNKIWEDFYRHIL